MASRDVGCGAAALENFGLGSGNLSPTVLQALVKYLLGDNVTLDLERDVLVRRKGESRPLSTVERENFDPKSTPYFVPPRPYQTRKTGVPTMVEHLGLYLLDATNRRRGGLLDSCRRLGGVR
jgi:hypothetical protein